MSPHLAIRLDYATTISRAPDVANRVAQVLARPAMALLARVSVREKDRWSKHAPATAETIEQYLTTEANDAVSLDNGRAGELTASAEIESGPNLNVKSPPAVRYNAYIVLPYDPAKLEEVLTAAFDLAIAMNATAGFVALETTYGLAHRVAVGQSIPKARVGYRRNASPNVASVTSRASSSIRTWPASSGERSWQRELVTSSTSPSCAARVRFIASPT